MVCAIGLVRRVCIVWGIMIDLVVLGMRRVALVVL